MFSHKCISSRQFSSFITTPIFYVNGSPHIGHLYSGLLADAGHRFRQLKDPQALHVFSTGTDEHGLKIEKAAKDAGLSPFQHVRKYAGEFKALPSQFNIKCTDFVQTTEPRHHAAVTHFWDQLQSGGFIYKGGYSGWYCLADETFVPESNTEEIVAKDGQRLRISSESRHPVEWTQEENYMFKLGHFQSRLLDWAKTGPVRPKKFSDLLVRWLTEFDGSDLSISRPRSRLSWGIEVPGDPSQTIYVWLDALVNYLTVSGYPQGPSPWPPIHVIGKDILKFHGIYWAGFLLAANLELPKILCHSHWTVDGAKMSKSVGNVMDPMELVRALGVDGLRYFLLREGVPHSDGNFHLDKAIRLLNAELADTLGNLLSRSSSLALNPHQVWPKETVTSTGLTGQLKISLQRLPDLVEDAYEEFNFYRGLEHLMETLRLANSLVQEEKPWVLVKESKDHPRLRALTSIILESLRVGGIVLAPITPNISANILDRLGVETKKRNWEFLRHFSWEEDCEMEERKLGENRNPIFQRIKQQ